MRLAVSVVTCMHAAIREPSNGRSFANRSRIWRSTGIARSAHSIRALPCAASDGSAMSCRGEVLEVMPRILRSVRVRCAISYTILSRGSRSCGITEAARRLRTTPRMLRYREGLACSPRARSPPASTGPTTTDDLRRGRLGRGPSSSASASPPSLSPSPFERSATPRSRPTFDGSVELTGRITQATRALDFDQLKAERLLRRPAP